MSVVLLGSDGLACPTSSAYVYDNYTPAFIKGIPHPSSYCDACDPEDSPGCSQHCANSLLYLPGDSVGNADPDNPYMAQVGDSLFVWLPGTYGTPSHNENILKIAAFTGYRTIGLSYYNYKDEEDICLGVPCALDYTDECAYQFRMERLTGIDNPNITFPIGGIPNKTFIAYRLMEALVEAHNWDMEDSVNDWQFGQYCVDSLGGCSLTANGPWLDRIRWDRIVLGGFSQGAGYPHILSLLTELDGIVSIDGGNDRCNIGFDANNQPISKVASYLPDLVSIWNRSGGASSGNGEFAAIHLEHGFWGMDYPEIVPDSYSHIQLYSTPFDLDIDPEAPPTSNVVRTDQSSACSSGNEAFHTAMANDDCMPTWDTWNNGHGSALPAGGYPPDLHVFSAYVQGFCDAHAL